MKSSFSAVSPNRAEQLRKLVGDLPAKQRACITLRYLQDLEYSEIAQALDCSQESARANVYQAIQRLRAAMKENP
jgi:RNA polymerase sigma factor (sigma-70 family)